MQDLIGRTLGHYRVVEQIGAGGMGVVYRAHDGRLDRDVAIKVLPEDVAGDAERLARFDHEAKLLASLSHQNIATLHGLDEHDGRRFLVMELLEGESLRSRVAAGSLPVKEAVALAIQVARGLAAAHARGVVHRDLKPENLFVTRDGVVKILDFGLASLQASGPTDGPLSQERTATRLTRAGTVLGTAGYMAPEQVRGLQVDQRADIFAFGCVLYEMLAGRRAFAGDTAADTLGAILKDEPVAIEVAVPGITPALGQIVRRCLEKGPEDRFSSAHDLALALEAAVSDVDRALASAVVAAQPRRRRLLLLGAVGAAIVVLAATGFWLRGRDHAAMPDPMLDPARVMVAPFENRTGDLALDVIATLTADAITHGLSELGEVTVLQAPASAAGDREVLLEAARAVDAGVLVSGTYYLTGDTLELRGRLTNTATEAPIYILEPEPGSRDQAETTVDRVRQRAMTAMLMHLGKAIGVGAVTRPPLFTAYREFFAGARAMSIDWPMCQMHFEQSAELDPGFWQPQIILQYIYRWMADEPEKLDAVRRRLWANQELMCPATRLLNEEYEALTDVQTLVALRKAQALVAMAPDDLMYVSSAAWIANDLQRPTDTLRVIGDIERFDWERARAWIQGARLLSVACNSHHQLGEHDAELEVIRFGRGLYPDALELLRDEASALAALGRSSEVGRVVDDALRVGSGEGSATVGDVIHLAAWELRAHGHPEAAQRIANRGADWYAEHSGSESDSFEHISCLVVAGRQDEARTMAERVREEMSEDDPWFVVAVGMCGITAAHLGDRPAAEAVDQELTGAGPAPLSRRFLRACIAAQLGEQQRAVKLLRESNAGNRGLFGLHANPFLEPLNAYPPFEELRQPKG
jgi:hypothetical protein